MSPVDNTALLEALEVKRDLSAHTAECAMRQRRLEEILSEIKADVKELRSGMEARVRTIEDERTEAKGGWRVIAVIGAAAGAVGAALIEALAKAAVHLGALLR